MIFLVDGPRWRDAAGFARIAELLRRRPVVPSTSPSTKTEGMRRRPRHREFHELGIGSRMRSPPRTATG